MEVEVTGTPDPVVTWHRDGLPITEVLKDPYKLKSFGNSHTLTIEKGINLTTYSRNIISTIIKMFS